MNPFILFLTAIALSMDAFAVSVSCGVGNNARDIGTKFKLAATFGIFQGLMPMAAYFLAGLIPFDLDGFAGIIAFLILMGVGLHMIKEAFDKNEKCGYGKLTFGRILILAVATSIDAFATGVGFALLDVNIWMAALEISLITFAVSLAGVFFGCKLGSLMKKGSEIAGGMILIVISLKFLIESII
ncbi:MAG: manganese efflux pump [Clostridia bacterium]|nr:manganese efflux pump [Clostridia bacterium]